MDSPGVKFFFPEICLSQHQVLENHHLGLRLVLNHLDIRCFCMDIWRENSHEEGVAAQVSRWWDRHWTDDEREGGRGRALVELWTDRPWSCTCELELPANWGDRKQERVSSYLQPVQKCFRRNASVDPYGRCLGGAPIPRWSSFSAPGPVHQRFLGKVGVHDLECYNHVQSQIFKKKHEYTCMNYIIKGSLVGKLVSSRRMVMVSLHNHHVNPIMSSTSSCQAHRQSIQPFYS